MYGTCKILYGSKTNTNQEGRLMNVDNMIYNFNKDRGLLDKPFDLLAEVRMLQEEMVELMDAECVEHILDALADLRVLVTGAMYKLGYDPRYVMMEVLTEITDRSGKYNEETGKWEKDGSPTYRADFSGCHLEG